MATSFYQAGSRTALRLQDRGYHVVYREHETNHCPGCGRSNWLIGRQMVECAFCETALPIEGRLTFGHPSVRHSGRQFVEDMLAA